MERFRPPRQLRNLPTRGPREDSKNLVLVSCNSSGMSTSYSMIALEAARIFSRELQLLPADSWRDELIAQLQLWAKDPHKLAKDANRPSQHVFWPLYEKLLQRLDGTHNPAPISDRFSNSLVAYSQGFRVRHPKSRVAGSHGSESNAPKELVVYDGQRRIIAAEGMQRGISAKSIRRIARAAIKEIYELDQEAFSTQALQVIGESLSQGVAKYAKWRELSHSESNFSDIPSTRDWVRSFVIYTGNPPPALGAQRSACGRALVILNTTAPEAEYEPVRQQPHGRSLQDTLYPAGPTARLNRRPRAYAPVGGGSQFAGRRSTRADFSLAKTASAVRSLCSREMACHV
jgi:hypothetical protein